jgi:hypothetical protein
MLNTRLRQSEGKKQHFLSETTSNYVSEVSRKVSTETYIIIDKAEGALNNIANLHYTCNYLQLC